MMTIVEIYFLAALVILVEMFALWVVSLFLQNSSIVDIFWGTGFVIVGLVYFSQTPDRFIIRKWLICILVTVWGLRLSWHVLRRNWKKPEDFRYQVWRKTAGSRWWWQSFFQVFLLQGFLLWLISIPLLAAQLSAAPGRLIILNWVAGGVWAIGFFFEAVGDWQLARFKANPANKGRVLQTGLWRYTRHPNYFGDATQWWAYYLVAVSAGGWWTIFSPIIMTILLVRVSGVALLEKSLKEARPDYANYIQTTSAFIPWFPRSPKSNRR
jgi:steroid 5-alpha reductase family enzyme